MERRRKSCLGGVESVRVKYETRGYNVKAIRFGRCLSLKATPLHRRPSALGCIDSSPVDCGCDLSHLHPVQGEAWCTPQTGNRISACVLEGRVVPGFILGPVENVYLIDRYKYNLAPDITPNKALINLHFRHTIPRNSNRKHSALKKPCAQPLPGQEASTAAQCRTGNSFYSAFSQPIIRRNVR